MAATRCPSRRASSSTRPSIGLFPDVGGRLALDVDSLMPQMVVADVIPDPAPTALLRDAQARGCVTLDGLGMLVNQAIIGIEYWTGLAADPVFMRQTLQALPHF